MAVLDAAQAIAGWRTGFDALIQARFTAPFEWGSNDCCIFAADAVREITGIDHAADVRGSYRTERGAARVLAQLGGVAELAAKHCQECPPLMARVGDVCLVMQGPREALAVCVGAQLVAPASGGLCVMPINAALRAWRTHG